VRRTRWAPCSVWGRSTRTSSTALDLLGAAQPKIEAALARRHLQDGCLLLYDLTSSWLEGRCCELARLGYSRDGKRDKLQIVFGLLCNAEGV
jgi:hypothetical protein